jgi:hypothetical protein
MSDFHELPHLYFFLPSISAAQCYRKQFRRPRSQVLSLPLGISNRLPGRRGRYSVVTQLVGMTKDEQYRHRMPKTCGHVNVPMRACRNTSNNMNTGPELLGD